MIFVNSYFLVYCFLRSVGAQASKLGVPFTVYCLLFTVYSLLFTVYCLQLILRIEPAHARQI